MMRNAQLLAAMLLLSLSTFAAQGAEVTVRVTDQDGKPVANAIVFVIGASTAIDPGNPPTVAIDQVDKEFVPYLTVVRPGTMITFPNSDNIRHHVYSFSETKRFEIPLYGDTEAPAIEFDQRGVVALGCNVHDWMRAYVLVADTEHYGLTGEDGAASLLMPAGSHQFQLWHPELRGESDDTRQTLAVGQSTITLDMTMRRKTQWRAWRSTDEFEEGY